MAFTLGKILNDPDTFGYEWFQHRLQIKSTYFKTFTRQLIQPNINQVTEIHSVLLALLLLQLLLQWLLQLLLILLLLLSFIAVIATVISIAAVAAIIAAAAIIAVVIAIAVVDDDEDVT